MITTYFITGVLLIIVGSFIIFAISEERKILAFIGMILYSIGVECLFHSKPQAIDVYRDKTTLKITYKDSIPTDSIVVFKNK